MTFVAVIASGLAELSKELQRKFPEEQKTADN